MSTAPESGVGAADELVDKLKAFVGGSSGYEGIQTPTAADSTHKPNSGDTKVGVCVCMCV
jgi:hypothetical protein